MIQRRQTLYLLLIILITALMLWLDQSYFVASGDVSDGDRTFVETVEVGYFSTRTADKSVGPNLRLIYFEAIIALVALVTIFLYKKRSLQVRLCIVNFIAMAGLFIMMYDYSFAMNYVKNPADQSLEYTALIPLALVILNFLAVRRIIADEKLVKSLDRLR